MDNRRRGMSFGAVAPVGTARCGSGLDLVEETPPPFPEDRALPIQLEPPYICVNPEADGVYCHEAIQAVERDSCVEAVYRGYSADVELCQVR